MAAAGLPGDTLLADGQFWLALLSSPPPAELAGVAAGRLQFHTWTHPLVHRLDMAALITLGAGNGVCPHWHVGEGRH